MDLGQVLAHEVLDQYDSTISVQILDQGGDAVNKNFVREVDGMMIVCDLTRPDTAQKIMEWSQQVVDVKPMPIVIVANKLDLAKTSEDYISGEELDELQASLELQYCDKIDQESIKIFTTSGVSGQAVDSAFKHMTWLLLQPLLEHIRKHLVCMMPSDDVEVNSMQESFRKGTSKEMDQSLNQSQRNLIYDLT